MQPEIQATQSRSTILRRPWLLVAAAVVVSLGAFALPATAPADASLLPAIDQARDLRETDMNTGPVLRKHYVEVSPGVFLAVKGERERRQVRMARWIDSLEGDRAAVLASQGFPTFRHRELEAGRTLEFWSYPEARVTFVFEGNRKVGREPF